MLLGSKKDPARIVTVCMVLVIGALVMSFMPRIGAQSAVGSGTIDYASINNPDGIIPGSEGLPSIEFGKTMSNILKTTGIYAFITDVVEKVTPAGDTISIPGWQELFMVLVGFLVIWLGAAKGFEPLLLIPIGFGVVFVNIPGAGIGSPGVWNEATHLFEHQGFLDIIYNAGVGNEFFPLLIFVGIGAMTDFGPLIANPKTALLGAAAQFGVFGAMFLVSLSNYIPGVTFNMKEASAVSIIGGAAARRRSISPRNLRRTFWPPSRLPHTRIWPSCRSFSRPSCMRSPQKKSVSSA
jgi:oxaloacetate decarboxylase beta subunit